MPIEMIEEFDLGTRIKVIGVGGGGGNAIEHMIGDADISLDDAREQLRRGGQLSELRSDLAVQKAIDWLVEHAEVVDPDGNAIDERFLQPLEHDHDHDDHDHGDHDHD